MNIFNLKRFLKEEINFQGIHLGLAQTAECRNENYLAVEAFASEEFVAATS